MRLGFRCSHRREEEDHWLVPINDRRRRSGSAREGMLEDFSLGSYLQLVDYTSRLCRSGKARLSGEVAEIFDRLGTSAEFWSDRLRKMLRSVTLRGCFFSGQRDRLRDLAAGRGQRHLANLSPQAPG